MSQNSPKMCAEQLGFLNSREATSQLTKTISSLEHFRTWFGFQQRWNSVADFSSSKSDTAVSVLDSANLCEELLSVSKLSPKLSARAKALFYSHQWAEVYDSKQKTLLGGVDTSSNKFNRQ